MRGRTVTVCAAATLLLGGCAATDVGALSPTSTKSAKEKSGDTKSAKPKKTKQPSQSKPNYPSQLFENCEAFHARWANGVARPGARDSTSGTPVTSFLVSRKIYSYAMAQNSGLDGDDDGVLCESE